MKTGKKEKKKDIVDGGKNVIEGGSLEDKEVKIRITTWVDSDVLQSLKDEAEERKLGYQTVLNQKLRKVVLGERDPLHERLGKLERTVQQLKKKVG